MAQKNAAVKGVLEDQLRAPLERFIGDLAELCGIPKGSLTVVGETSLADLKTRPDYTVTRDGALVGFIEVKAPGKGADPRKFRGHDKDQWEKLKSLPNLIYTDGNAFSLWRNGELDGTIQQLIGDIETAGASLDAPSGLLTLFENFFQWHPVAPRNATELAEMSARLCRLLRDEVTERLVFKDSALMGLARDWRGFLFPEASDARFADGYAQAVTFGLLVARAFDIPLDNGLDLAAKRLGKSSSLIGAALRILTDDAENQARLQTSLGTLTRVLNVVHWPSISRGSPDAWLYFYEEFLAVYDNALRKQTGSYYTPPEVVGSMVRLVDDALRTRFSLSRGLASPVVKLVDPAAGTGTFLLGVLKQIANSVAADEGAGAVPDAMNAAVNRLVAFEMQLGPFAVAQLRVLAELTTLLGGAPPVAPRMFVTDTLGDPYVEERYIPQIMQPIAVSRREANKVKREERITVVLGNPPYKDKANGKGGWVENGSKNSKDPPLLEAWIPPSDWGVGAHVKHLRNLYVYFWRWATWKVFDHDPANNTGIVCFITVAGFLNGPGFQRMREYLRRTADEVWVIDCSPEGHRPDVNTRIFEAVQQPVCIVLASRSPNIEAGKTPANVRFRALPPGPRREKFAALESISLDDTQWTSCPRGWRDPFLPAASGEWARYPALNDLFVYDGSGVMPGRTWVIAPDAASLEKRWQALVNAPDDKKEHLFHPHLVGGKPGDRHVNKPISKGLPGSAFRAAAVSNDREPCIPPIRYGFRSFDRQWIIPDARLLNRPNPELWRAHSNHQVYLTVPFDRSPTAGPALCATALIPDLHHYNGRGGRAIPLWLDHSGEVPNIRPGLLAELGRRYGRPVSAEDVFVYIAAVAAHPAFTARFLDDLKQPGLRIPITASRDDFVEAVDLGRTVIWLHCFGERFVDSAAGRPAKAPRLPPGTAPAIPARGTIQTISGEMPDHIEYDAASRRILIGEGYVEHVPPGVWNYEISGKHVLRQWFSYRKKTRERPLIGDRREPSPLGDIQPERWPAEYTTELLGVLNVLGCLVELEPKQSDLLNRICAGPIISFTELKEAGALDVPPSYPKSPGAIADPRDAGAIGRTIPLPGLDAPPVDRKKKPRSS